MVNIGENKKINRNEHGIWGYVPLKVSIRYGRKSLKADNLQKIPREGGQKLEIQHC